MLKDCKVDANFSVPVVFVSTAVIGVREVIVPKLSSHPLLATHWIRHARLILLSDTYAIIRVEVN